VSGDVNFNDLGIVSSFDLSASSSGLSAIASTIFNGVLRLFTGGIVTGGDLLVRAMNTRYRLASASHRCALLTAAVPVSPSRWE
jgi:hypothetical protein